MSDQAYVDGFVRACAERGCDPQAVMKAAGIGDVARKGVKMVGDAAARVGAKAKAVGQTVATKGKAVGNQVADVGRKLAPKTPGEGAIAGGGAGVVAGAAIQANTGKK